MINEECLARPTWEMAHLQTQVRRGGLPGISLWMAGSFQGLGLPRSSGKGWVLATECFRRCWREVSLLVIFSWDIQGGGALSHGIKRSISCSSSPFILLRAFTHMHGHQISMCTEIGLYLKQKDYRASRSQICSTLACLDLVQKPIWSFTISRS